MEGGVPTAMSFRAGRPVDMDGKGIRPIDTLSREISCRHAARTIEKRDFSTPVEMTVWSLMSGRLKSHAISPQLLFYDCAKIKHRRVLRLFILALKE